ncbi:MAG: hypothetical protein ACWGOX_04330, partial [Desulforhopalus sp.]
LTLSFSDKELAELLANTKVIAITPYDHGTTAHGDISVPVASYSEYSGTVINCDNILQSFAKAVTKNNDLGDISEIAVLLGSPLQSPEDRYRELQQVITVLNGFASDKIPSEGLNLNDSEAANVTA